jgi:putative phosphoribosyl transferase
MPVVDAVPVRIPAGPLWLDGDLDRREASTALVAFAHGSGSSRRSPRNRRVAGVLADAGLATLRFDLLTPDEEEADAHTGRYRFDIERLSHRLIAATDWLQLQPETHDLPLGYFGASTGAAAAERPDVVGAVVSRGGRPDLAGDALPRLQAPILLLVGGRDETVQRLNESAATRLRAPHRLQVIPGATHLFEEPGALDQVALLARDWFVDYLRRPDPTD